MSAPLFRASIVGSMPRSQFVRDLLDPERAPKDPVALRQALDAAVDYVVALQEMAGLDVISDGEYRRRSYIGIIADVCDGFLLERRDGVWWHTVVAPLKVVRPGLAAAEARYLRARTRRQIKVALPSPYLLGQRMWDEARSREAYPTREAFMEALVPILRDELVALRDAGADIVQLDDPHLCLFVDASVRARYPDPDREVDLCVELVNGVLGGVTGVTRAIHLCRRNKGRAGWVGSGGYDPILPALKRLEVEQYVLEFTIPVAGDLSVLRELPEDRQVGLGCVDCRGAVVDSVEQIVARVEQALAHLRPEQVVLNPDCGFAPGNAAEIPIDEAYAKLQHEARAAALLRERHG
ncbi:MAG: cobalamin-independent methionine synthase II family protein, partial [Deltaproteobacteria bacterium]|nr:cobalamin-independent methionine synthase II family protein [Deltaproteobacteria bacterium]